ncbi:tyrosine-type recombinase/integrase [Maribellus sp. CM-23]|uniref:tyrosine-type recombinase/integrase n=1 Tax=Maribellus sp. CM-23 TaxID=2781026 RepID=UPI001F25050D|nr:tyrosine-type recombinase/integrase [Maribellus sp. CM-23]MCE4566030.1 tyrosine-type recombinase/integrase [Maribellus sp. CM-23]
MSLPGQRTTTSSMDWDDFKSLIFKLERDKNYKYCLLITIGTFTGLRISDLLQLKWCQFDDADYLNVVEKKTKKDRKIKINPDLLDLIGRIKVKMEITDTNQYIFLNRYGTKPIDRSWVNVNLKKIFKKYNIKVEGNVSTHMFRKTLGNRVLKLNNYSNESIVLLNNLFQHSSIQVTKVYLGIKEREIMSVYDSLRL